MKIKALVPIKANSERLKNKNFLSFCGQPLYQIILDKLQTIDLIDEIVINTDSKIVAVDCLTRYSKAVIIERPSRISANEITMNTIIEYDMSKTLGEHFLQTHCTNPLISVKTIVKAIHQYINNLDKYDSLLSVESVQKRVYHSDKTPINHSHSKLEQTQNLPEVYIENSNLFLFSRTSFHTALCSRVGVNPQLFSMSFVEGMDIDYKEDFLLAELIYKNQELFDSSN